MVLEHPLKTSILIDGLGTSSETSYFQLTIVTETVCGLVLGSETTQGFQSRQLYWVHRLLPFMRAGMKCSRKTFSCTLKVVCQQLPIMTAELRGSQTSSLHTHIHTHTLGDTLRDWLEECGVSAAHGFSLQIRRSLARRVSAYPDTVKGPLAWGTTAIVILFLTFLGTGMRMLPTLSLHTPRCPSESRWKLRRGQRQALCFTQAAYAGSRFGGRASRDLVMRWVLWTVREDQSNTPLHTDSRRRRACCCGRDQIEAW